MTIPAAHQDAIIAYLAAHGEQRYGEIYKGMSIYHPEVRITAYLMKKLQKAGRIERVGLDTYRAVQPKVEDAS